MGLQEAAMPLLDFVTTYIYNEADHRQGKVVNDQC